MQIDTLSFDSFRNKVHRKDDVQNQTNQIKKIDEVIFETGNSFPSIRPPPHVVK